MIKSFEDLIIGKEYFFTVSTQDGSFTTKVQIERLNGTQDIQIRYLEVPPAWPVKERKVGEIINGSFLFLKDMLSETKEIKKENKKVGKFAVGELVRILDVEYHKRDLISKKYVNKIYKVIGHYITNISKDICVTVLDSTYGQRNFLEKYVSPAIQPKLKLKDFLKKEEE